jgi:hypothetical protein
MRTKRNAKFPELWKELENKANGGEGVVVRDGLDVVGLRAGAQAVSEKKKARIIDEPIVMQQRDINSNAAGVRREAARLDVDASELERVPLERGGFAWVGGQDTEAGIDEADEALSLVSPEHLDAERGQRPDEEHSARETHRGQRPQMQPARARD